MRLPDFSDLGSYAKAEAPTPDPSSAVAGYANATAPGEANQQLGTQAQEAGSHLQDMLNVADVNNVMGNEFQPKIRDLAQNFYSLTGKAAMDAAPQYSAAVQSAIDQSGQNLTGQARTDFVKSAQPIVDRELYRASEHAGQQAVVYATQSHEAVQSNSITDLTTHLGGGDVSSAHDDVGLARANEAAFMKSQGIDPNSDIGKYRLTELDNKIQAGVAAAILSKPPDQQIAIAHSFMNPAAAQAGQPKDMGADFVKPYTPQQVAGIQAKVAAPSPYDDLFQRYGQQYGIDPQELKLHAVAESGLDPKADNGQSQGLMQLSNANVKALGVTDPFDPAQSIEGAAKLMAQNKTAGATDTHSADLMYYGGSDPKQQGPNSQQYAANLAAVRGGASGSPSTSDNPSGISSVSSNASYMGFPLKQKTAETITQAALENKSHADKLQEIQYNNRVQSFAADPHFTSMLQVPQDIRDGFNLAPKTQDYLEGRAQYNLKNSENIVDADKLLYGSGFYNLLQNVYSPNGITKASDLYQYTGQNGVLTIPGFDALKQEIDQKNSPQGQAVAEAKARLFDSGANTILGEAKSFGVSDPKGEQLHARWLALTLNDYQNGVKAGKSPTQLLDPESPDYVGKSVTMFTRSDAERLKDQTNAPPRTLDTVDSDIRYGRTTPEQARAEVPGMLKNEYASGRMTKDQVNNGLIRFGLLTQKPAAIPVRAPRPGIEEPE